MIPQILIHIDEERALRVLDRVATVQAGAPELMREIAGIMHDEVEANFEAQGRPRWLPVKESSLLSKYRRDMFTRKGNLRRGGFARFAQKSAQNKILQDSGQLASSVVMSFNATQAVVGSNKVYAAIHQFGGKTRPHVIRARRRRALAFGGILRRQVNHPGSDIPARPFLVLGPDGGRRIETAGLRYLQRLTAAR